MDKIKLLEYLKQELTYEPKPLIPIFNDFNFKEAELELILNSLLRDGFIFVQSIETDSFYSKNCYLIWKTQNFNRLADQFISLKKDFIKLNEEINLVKESFNNKYTLEDVTKTNEEHYNLIEEFQNLKEAVRGILSNLAEHNNCTFTEIYEKYGISPSD